MTDSSLPETDIVAWADRQAEELRRLAEARETTPETWAGLIAEIERGAVSMEAAGTSLTKPPSNGYMSG